MTRGEQRFRALMDRSLGPFRNPSPEHVEAACQRVLHNLREEEDGAFERVETKPVRVRADRRWPLAVVACSAAAAVVALLWIPLRERVLDGGALARVEMVDGTLHLASRGERLLPGDRIDAGDLVRTNGGAGAMVVLSDGSRVEMRSQSELALERADDGVRVRLNRGGIIVNAVKQRTGHLYVQTRDVTVSVVGTVFLVNAEEAGSRVAVIEGEIRVQQGTMEKTLLAGEQVATSLVMATQPVPGGISWSRNAAAHIVRLQESASVASLPTSQSVVDRQQSATQPPGQQRPAFEAVSIRPSTSNVVPGGRGGGPVPANGCGNGLIQVDPRRVFIGRVTLQWLIVTAYRPWTSPRGGCEGVGNANLLSGGPNWVRSDLWDIEALIPQDNRGLTLELASEAGSDLQEMLQAELAERFKLVLRRETKQMPVYMLTVGTGGARFNGPIDLGRRIVFEDDNGKLVGPDEVRGAAKLWRNRDESGNSFVRLGAFNMSMAAWTRLLSRDVGRLVLDRTGLTGEFSFHFEYDPAGVTRPTLFNAVEEIGLKFEEGQAPVEVWSIERAEKPMEN